MPIPKVGKKERSRTKSGRWRKKRSDTDKKHKRDPYKAMQEIVFGTRIKKKSKAMQKMVLGKKKKRSQV